MKEDFRLPLEFVDAFLEDHGLTWKQIESGARVWPYRNLKIALTPQKIETLIAAGDPVVWALLNMVSPMDIPGLCRAGDPLVLTPIQTTLARLENNVIAECAAEVGKTQDIGVRLLHRMDTAGKGDVCMIVANTELTAKSIWRYLRDQVEANPRIGGGTKREDKRTMSMEFRAGPRFETRLTGDDGEALRSAHMNGIIFCDEVAKYKKQQIWSELWRSGMPGCVFRLYTTPDGDYSSPYFALSARAQALNGKNAEEFEEIDRAPDDFATSRFQKIWISKEHLGPPFYTEERKVSWREMYGPEHSTGYLNNVFGLWGTPASSVFPAYVLEPMLTYDLDYRVVTAQVDREKATVKFAAAELSKEKNAEAVLEQTTERFDPSEKGAALAGKIASFFPASVATWTDPQLYCGVDLGESQDPSEYLFVRRLGDVWEDIFRVHLEYVMYPEQAKIVAALDHASGHRVKYGFDPGNAGSSFVQQLTESGLFDKCELCAKPIHLEERVRAFGFAEKSDDIDLRSGRPIPNPDDRDAAGNMKPFRVSNKEFATRVLERKSALVEMRMARDGGAGDPTLAGPALMMNHTATGEKSQKGERRFRGKDDHLVDARRQVALLIVSEMRSLGGFVSASMDGVVTIGVREGTSSDFLGGSFGGAFDIFPDEIGRPFAGGEW